MKTFLAAMVTICLSLVLLAAGVHVASAVVSEPEQHTFANLNAPSIWTAEPERIDRAAQDFQRLPDRIAANPVLNTQEQAKVNAAKRKASMIKAGTTGDIGGQQTYDSAHLNWCYERYRSYREDDNSYQPYSGGPRRSCASPFDAADESATGQPLLPAGMDDGPMTAQADVSSNSHTDWCHGRYASYRPSDNSYQPYAGARRECLSPYF